MRIQVQFFATFREIFDSKTLQIEVGTGATVEDLLNLVFNTHERRERIFDNGKLKPHIIVMKNGRHIQHLKGLETELNEGDTVSVFPPIAGG
ncbi:MAG TPA: ubiquitin-like small modifier protein 1 [Desulfatiglandales bacterium]|nr:ubiquitin-like small modifier protein 1 [Desulfatiglandales bacterium]